MKWGRHCGSCPKATTNRSRLRKTSPTVLQLTYVLLPWHWLTDHVKRGVWDDGSCSSLSLRRSIVFPRYQRMISVGTAGGFGGLTEWGGWGEFKSRIQALTWRHHRDICCPSLGNWAIEQRSGLQDFRIIRVGSLEDSGSVQMLDANLTGRRPPAASLGGDQLHNIH